MSDPDSEDPTDPLITDHVPFPKLAIVGMVLAVLLLVAFFGAAVVAALRN